MTANSRRRLGEDRHELLHHLQLLEGLPERSARNGGIEFQDRTRRIGGRRVAARSGGPAAEDAHREPFERQRAAGNAHLARDVADRHLFEKHLSQIGVEREVQVARDLDGPHRFRRSLFVRGPAFRRGHGVHDLVQVEQLRFHVEAPRKHVVPQQVTDVTGQLAVGRKVAPADRQAELPERHRGGRDGGRSAADTDRREVGKRQPHPFDDEGSLRAQPFVAVLLDVGHAARKF